MDETKNQSAEGSYIAQANDGSNASITIIQQVMQPPDILSQRNRKRILQKVYDFWIDGVLNNSLYNGVLVDVGMEYNPNLIIYPWDMILQKSQNIKIFIPENTKIIDIYDQSKGELLILGEPGSGKTTILLNLARDLLERSINDDNLPIPVILNLSSWSKKQEPIDEWIIKELNIRYNVPNTISKEWLEADKLLLLLDGLDEVSKEKREPCIDAINTFINQHTIDIVICSRTYDYEELNRKLNLQTAIVLKELTADQINNYFKKLGSVFDKLHKSIKENSKLRELAKVPLTLNIMAMAYRENNDDVLQNNTEEASQTSALFSTYISQMFKRRGLKSKYSPDQTTQWLSWLAHKMNQNGETIFNIESIQPNWLNEKADQRFYIITFNILMRLFTGLSLGFCMWLPFGLIWGLIFFFIGVFLINPDKKTEKVKLIESLKWSPRKAKKDFWKSLKNGFYLSGMFIYIGIFNESPIEKIFIFGTIWGISNSLIFIFMNGFSDEEVKEKSEPNQGIWLTLRSSIIGSLADGIVSSVGGTFYFVVAAEATSSDVNLLNVITLWSIPGLIYGWIDHGGISCLKHVMLRFLLWRSQALPLDIISFLDYAVERTFMRRVGGGYIFIHRLPMEYFASLSDRSGKYFQVNSSVKINIYAYIVIMILLLSSIVFSLVRFSPVIYNQILLDNYVASGNRLLDNKNYNSAISNYTSAIQLDPEYFDALYNRCLAYYLNGDYDLAVKDCTKAIEIDPNYNAAFVMRAFAYSQNKNDDLAIKDYTHAINNDSSNAESFYYRGLSHLNRKDYDLAIEDCTKAIEIDPNYNAAFAMRASAYSQNKNDDLAIKDYTHAINNDSSNAESFYYRGRGLSYLNRKDYDLAIKDYTKAIEIDPSYNAAFVMRAFAYSQNKNDDLAIKDYTHAINNDSSNAESFYYRGLSYLNKEKYNQALADFSKSITLNPKYSENYYYRGITYLALKKHKNALADYENLKELSPQIAKELKVVIDKMKSAK